MSQNHQVSDSDSDATLDPNEDVGAESDVTIDPNDEDGASDGMVDDDKRKEEKQPTSQSQPAEKNGGISRDKAAGGQKGFQFRRTYTAHNMSDSDSEPDTRDPSVKHKAKPTPKQSPLSKHSPSKSSLEKSTSLHDISDSDSDTEIKPQLSKQKIHYESPLKDDSHKLKRRQSTPTKSSTSSSLSKESPVTKSPLTKSASSPQSLKSKTPEQSPSSPAEDKRPYCPYGNACYRKSQAHIKNFQHIELFKDPEPACKRARHDNSTDLPPEKVVTLAHPFSFLLTKVTGIEDKYNNDRALHIKDILSPSMGKLEKSAQFNYCIDLNWLLEQYPEEYKTTPITVVHGSQRQEKRALELEAKPYPQLKLCQAKLEIMYGTHHTKMMFLKYDKGLRVVIHTANLVEKDWYQKTQGIWVSPVFPSLPASSATDGDSVTGFKRDLLEYVSAYKAPLLTEWIDIIKEHDLSAAKVFLVGSVPGRHTGEQKARWGHMKMRKILSQHGPDHSVVKDWPLVAQFSSVGSLGGNKESWLCGEWLASLGSCRGTAGGMKATSTKLKLVFPSKETVRLSLEGYPAGQSIPYSYKTAMKQQYLHTFWHQWKSDTHGRSRACPHIKTYFRYSPDSTHLAWFMVTSANMSKAAWGVAEKGGSQLMIRSYELGVLFLPKYFSKEETFAVSEESAGKSLVFPLPYDLPLTPYSSKDRPWLWDIPYVDLPDTHGNMWCPPV